MKRNNKLLSAPDLSNSEDENTITNKSFADKSIDIWLSKPKDWSDDVRMNALFAPFRNRDLNPLHYDNKLKFWKEAIQSYCDEKNILKFNLSELENYFQRNNVKPKCLGLVIDEMIKEKTLSTREDILKPKESLLKNVFSKLVWKPLIWSTSYLLKSITTSETTTTILQTSSTYSINKSINPSKSIDRLSTKNDDNYFVFTNKIESRSHELLKLLQDKVVYRNVDSLVEDGQIYSISDKYCKSDLELIIEYLKVNQKLIIDDKLIENKKLIKFTLNMNSNVEPINEMELSFYKLKHTERRLESESNKLSHEIENLNENIKDAIKQENKNLSLKYLKKRKQLEKNLENKDAVLANLQAIITSIQQADTNQITYDIFSKSLNVLKEVNKDIKAEKVDETIMDLQEMISSINEIEQTLAHSPLSSPKYSNFEDQELNKELNDLLNESKYDSEEVKKLSDKETYNDSFDFNAISNLPKIPISSPSKASKLSNNS